MHSAARRTPLVAVVAHPTEVLYSSSIATAGYSTGWFRLIPLRADVGVPEAGLLAGGR